MKSTDITKASVVGIVLTGIGMVFVAALIGSVFVWWGWNISMPHIFGLPQIDILQALGLSLTGGIFKSYSTK